MKRELPFWGLPISLLTSCSTPAKSSELSVYLVIDILDHLVRV